MTKIHYKNNRIKKADRLGNWARVAYYLQDWYSRTTKISSKDKTYILQSAKRLQSFYGDIK